MSGPKLALSVIGEELAISQLPTNAPIPAWAGGGGFVSIARTDEELSIVCEAARVPAGVKSERGWRCLKVAGLLDFEMVGVLASLVGPLAEAGVSVFAVSTFDTDYLLVREDDLAAAMAALRRAGHRVDVCWP